MFLTLLCFGNVGAWAAEIFAEQGGKVIAVSDALSATRNDKGLDITALRRHFDGGNSLDTYTEGHTMHLKHGLRCKHVVTHLAYGLEM